MLLAFLESIKYVGHIYPIAFLRIYVGYYWFNLALIEYKTGLFVSQVFVDEFKATETYSNFPNWYQSLFENLIYPNWVIVSHSILALALAIGVSLLIGLMVRPFCVLAILMCSHFLFINQAHAALSHSVFIATFITFILSGAGRCFGLDYYFYKRNRGLWW